jgi:VWFA-related protein
VFRAGVEAVWLDVFVSSREAPVTGLSAADFEVLDNGVGQLARVADLEAVGVTAVLVLDTSESVRGPRLEDLKLACRALLDRLTARDQAALLTFSHQLVLRSPASADREQLSRALALVPAAGATSAFDALYAALKHPWPERPMVLLFTDGADTLSWLRPDDVLQAARESEALVHVVASAPGVNDVDETAFPVRAVAEQRRRLREIVETTGGRFWELPPGGSLEKPFLEILAAMRARYLLSYEPRGVERPGRHRLQVKVKGRSLDVRHRLEYSVPAPRGKR